MNIIGISGFHNSVSFKRAEMPDLTKRAYRIVQGFDAAAALVNQHGIVAAAAEERFTGEKATGSFPVNAIEYCLAEAHLRPEDIDYIAHSFAYEPLRSVYQQNEFSRKQFAEVYSLDAQLRLVQHYFPEAHWAEKFVQVPHHLAHAASAYYVSGFADALILVTDGMGEAHSATVAIGTGKHIEVVKQVPSLHSLGILYGVLSLYLGFSMNSDEYKVMGLAPYGDAEKYYAQLARLVQLRADGTYTIPILYKNPSLYDKQTYSGTLRALEELLGPQREPGTTITQKHMDIAAALQRVLQESLLHTLRHYQKETGLKKLCLAGGVALNCTANGVIQRSKLFDQLFIQPAAGDDGSALGAALYVQHQYQPKQPASKMTVPYWGPSYSDEEVRDVLASTPGQESTAYEDVEQLAQEIARELATGKVVAWFQGRMEFGPRALGNRSILADPTLPHMRDHLNSIIKKREDFRPFAPAVAIEDASRFFTIADDEAAVYACMLLTTQVQPAYQDKLPAITHVDGSARVQTVEKHDNPRFWSVIKAFEKQTGFPIILNTSFNLRDQPIVCTPQEALQTYLSSEIDLLVLNNTIVRRV